MIISTTPAIEGRPVREHHGVVVGEARGGREGRLDAAPGVEAVVVQDDAILDLFLLPHCGATSSGTIISPGLLSVVVVLQHQVQGGP